MAIDVEILLFVRCDQLVPIAERLRVVWRCAVEGVAVRRHEADSTVVEPLNHHVSFVHLPVMESAEADEVRKLSLAAVCPMLDVVSVEITRVRAAGKATAAVIARPQRALQSRRDAACLAADVERFTVLALYYRNDAAVAGETSGGFRGDRWAVFELAAACSALT